VVPTGIWRHDGVVAMRGPALQPDEGELILLTVVVGLVALEGDSMKGGGGWG
jgi:hypothetical protein